jgi:hypothetical protein
MHQVILKDSPSVARLLVSAWIAVSAPVARIFGNQTAFVVNSENGMVVVYLDEIEIIRFRFDLEDFHLLSLSFVNGHVTFFVDAYEIFTTFASPRRPLSTAFVFGDAGSKARGAVVLDLETETLAAVRTIYDQGLPPLQTSEKAFADVLDMAKKVPK